MTSERPDLRAVLEFYGVEIPGNRREQSIKCPVHEEDRASCSLNLDDGLWSCHACGAGGDAWTLIMKKEGFSEFRAAVEFAEAKLGLRNGGVPQPARRSGSGVSRNSRPGFKPRYRNSAPRTRPLSSS